MFIYNKLNDIAAYRHGGGHSEPTDPTRQDTASLRDGAGRRVGRTRLGEATTAAQFSEEWHEPNVVVEGVSWHTGW